MISQRLKSKREHKSQLTVFIATVSFLLSMAVMTRNVEIITNHMAVYPVYWVLELISCYLLSDFKPDSQFTISICYCQPVVLKTGCHNLNIK
ncbi:hypothetical protein EB796_013853 [Bugula neritina]|uniref:Uncharacterized protein n=1 Tax=Bugula neritina TaxID=10212 RepID=A0A7J7JQ68_BUGNE|nr:hypothetical protein EB796_013853 [Bugula neritina]